MKKFILGLALAFVLVTTTTAQAHQHTLGTVTGNQIDLKEYDHAVAGSIKGFVVWGSVDEATGTSQLIMRQSGQTIKTDFAQAPARTGGTISSLAEDGSAKVTTVLFKGLDRSINQYTFEVNGKVMTVDVTSEDFKNNHFINPTYTATLNGETVSYTLKGEACYKYSLHLAFLVLGAYFH